MLLWLLMPTNLNSEAILCHKSWSSWSTRTLCMSFMRLQYEMHIADVCTCSGVWLWWQELIAERHYWLIVSKWIVVMCSKARVQHCEVFIVNNRWVCHKWKNSSDHLSTAICQSVSCWSHCCLHAANTVNWAVVVRSAFFHFLNTAV